MTRERALKKIIRARAAKTGERYTTARRHVLAAMAVPTPPRPPAVPSDRRSPISDAKIVEKTGHGLDHWFVVLDRFGGPAKGHTALARHLYDDHHVPGWHAQGITTAYERARGVRVVNQRCDGEFEVSVSKVLPGTVTTVIKAFTSAPVRKQWIEGVDPDLAAALTAAVKDKRSKGFVVRPDGLGRFRFKWGATTVQFYLQPKPGSKVSFVVTHMKLLDAGAVEKSRRAWKQVLGAVAQVAKT
ncbi:MAG: hypothetical protein FJW14_00575 [Acidimicrobiia bacterium]|nr:hypothetical protein [Acidimicrobiia bacterium]